MTVLTMMIKSMTGVCMRLSKRKYSRYMKREKDEIYMLGQTSQKFGRGENCTKDNFHICVNSTGMKYDRITRQGMKK